MCFRYCCGFLFYNNFLYFFFFGKIMVKLFCRLNVKIFFYWQLRVVRVFKSTLEDLEEKRSVNSFYSFYSLRSFRFYQGLRFMSESVIIVNYYERICRRLITVFERLFFKMFVFLFDFGFRFKSQFYENVFFVFKQSFFLMVLVNFGYRDFFFKILS